MGSRAQLYHQQGATAVMPYVAAQAAHGRVCDGGVLFLTPCHATPFYSHVHRDVPMRFLDCSPPPTPDAPVCGLCVARSQWSRLPAAAVTPGWDVPQTPEHPSWTRPLARATLSGRASSICVAPCVY